MAVKLPRLRNADVIVDQTGRPSTAFQIWWQQFADLIERAINGIAEILGITEELDAKLAQAEQLIAQVEQVAADAQTAAETAQQAADEAAQQAATQRREAALQASYIDPSSVVSADPLVVTIAGHTRIYGDGTSASVDPGTTATIGPAGTINYVHYDDPARTGGGVTYQVSTTAPVQSGDRHVVGAVTVPAAGTQGGGEGPRQPGYVQP